MLHVCYILIIDVEHEQVIKMISFLISYTYEPFFDMLMVPERERERELM